jgi:hypothetical protein
MKTIYYKKQGRRYVPIAEYDNEYLDSFPRGHHLVSVMPGCTNRRFHIDPALAPMIAAGLYAEDAISKAVVKASEMRPHQKPITETQKKAWDDLAKAFDSDRYYVELPSAREIAEAGVKAMQEEVDKLMKHESVRKSYEHFLLMCKLAEEHDERT